MQSIKERCEETARNFTRLAAAAANIEEAAAVMQKAIAGGGKVLFCGNGGSAADSQHLAAELLGRFLRERAPLAAIALTTNTSALSAIANDFGYAEVFARQLAGLGNRHDALVCLSTSGNSANVVRAAETAKTMAIPVIALTGADGGKLAAVSDILINVPAQRVDLIQEMHIAVGHMLCGIVEQTLSTAT